MSIRSFWNFIFSPKLYQKYTGIVGSEANYTPGAMESFGDQIITSLYIIGNAAIYTSPVWSYLLFSKGYFTPEYFGPISKFGIGVMVVLITSYCLRGYGRMNTPLYVEFKKVLDDATTDLSPITKSALSQYDFDFRAWPVEFSWDSIERNESNEHTRTRSRRAIDRDFFYGPCSILSYVAAHTFGIRLIYPGCIRVLKFVLSAALAQGRMKLVNAHKGQRYKLKTRDMNEIDTMFVDRRNSNRTEGNTLVICSEGNAGFYEIGIMITPLKSTYSVLGWNHPGFAGSSGMPFPEQEQNAIDIVMQFAIHSLGFTPQNIVLFGWSIGGYTTSWAAMSYPDVKAVIIDASFDDLLPLAIPRMPSFLEPIVYRTVRHHVNLNNAAQLCQYPGPIKLFRRTEDEVICLEPGVLGTNRGNHLLVQLLRYRYPNLFCTESEEALNRWFDKTGTQQSAVMVQYKADEERCSSILARFMEEEEPPAFPSSFGLTMNASLKCQMLLYIASKMLGDYATTHCTPLPATMFFIPQLL